MLTKDSSQEKLFKNQVGGPYWTVPELLLEKKEADSGDTAVTRLPPGNK